MENILYVKENTNKIKKLLNTLYIQGITGKVGQLLNNHAKDYGFEVINYKDFLNETSDCKDFFNISRSSLENKSKLNFTSKFDISTEEINQATNRNFKINNAAINNADVIIDFSHPESIDYFLKLDLKNKVIVCGTTGANNLEEYFNKLQKLSKQNKVFYSSNMSKGIFILKKILEYYLEFNTNIQPNILDIHHMHKKDSPSGTAKLLGNLFKNPTYESKRVGTEIGTHQITFANEIEEISFIHKTKDRSIYATAALEIAKWLLKKESKGFYSMDDYFQNK
ncbi:MAG: dihydrodipicolinate reductase C-terminal domain-containing protein [Rickettsiales bacterium]